MSRFRIPPQFIIVLTVFFDLLSISLLIPVAAPLFLGTTGGLFGPEVALQYRVLMLGIVLGVAPLIQFFAAPLLGAYADRVGRKPVLLVTVMLTGISHVLAGMGILEGGLILIVVSRVLAGFGAANMSAANSAMVDISTPETKVRNFGLIGMALGLGFIFGPFLGGKLSDPTLVSWFDLSTPLWIAAGLSLMNAVMIQLFFRETLRQPMHRPMTIFTGVRNLVRAFTVPHLRTLYISSFLLGFGFNFFTQFFSVFLIARFHFGSSEIGTLFALIGVSGAVTQGLVTRVLSRVVRPVNIVRWAPLITIVALLVLARVQHTMTLYWLLPIIAMSYGVNPPNMNTMISNNAGAESQGEALGINQSMQALSFGIPPIIAGALVPVDAATPLWAAALFVFIAWAVFVRYGRRPTRSVFHEV